MSNIKAEETYDPFPKSGLVKQYEPFIRARVGEFVQAYPQVRFEDVLIEAVRIAVEVEPRFKPERGYDFATFLGYPLDPKSRGHLKGLHRFVKGEQKDEEYRLRLKSGDADFSDEVLPASIPVPDSPYKEDERDAGESVSPSRDLRDLDQIKGFKPLTVDAEIAHALAMQKEAAAFERRLAEEFLPTEAIEYGAGGNATPVAFDMKGAIIGLRLYDNTAPHVMAVMDRLSPDLRALLGFPVRESRLTGMMRAVVAHGERRARETEQEAVNQKSGDYDPVFREVRTGLRPGIKFREPKKRVIPRLDLQKPAPVSERPDLTRLDPALRECHPSDRLPLLLGAAEVLRLSLDDKERAVLDWLLKPGRRNLTALAKEIDITKGYASKLRGRVLDLLRKRMTVTPEKRTELIRCGAERLTNKDWPRRTGWGSTTWPWRK